ncbi:hypothetical protein V3W47_09490 [Deinococcus sp. YIM 134068]|uniref:hypothetical protein n=1 Tax=Deinococcus lichenicola TaxID=3118910 RepID=UPI002F95D8BE
MSVDMNVFRFRQELQRLPTFVPLGRYDQMVQRASIPAWRAVFTSVVLMRHVAGYSLPGLDLFVRCYAKNFQHHEAFRRKKPDLYARLMTDEGWPTPGLLRRLSSLYETGMTEIYVYAVLAQAVEDKLQRGLVLYDARVDWKGKCDVVVLSGGRALRIDTHYDPGKPRGQIERMRDETEQETKVNTHVSSHWNNTELKAMRQLCVVRSAADHEKLCGFTLFSRTALDGLLTQVYDELRVPLGERVWMEELLTTPPGQ